MPSVTTRSRSRVSPSTTLEYIPWSKVESNAYRSLSSEGDSRFTNYVTRIQSIDDTVTPGYATILAAGKLLPMNPMNSQKVNWASPLILKAERKYEGDWGWWGEFTGVETRRTVHLAPYPSPVTDLSTAIKRCDAIAIANAKTDAFHAVTKALVVLAELGKTTDLLLGLRTRFLRHFISVLKSIQPKNWHKIYDAVSSVYMEIRFGWRPFVYELQDIHDSFTKTLAGRARFTVRGHHSETIVTEAVFEDQVFVKRGWGSYTKTIRTESIVSTKVTLIISLMNDGVAAEMRQRFGVLDLGPTFWELIPLSWLVDYFLNVGNTIEAISGSEMYQVSDSCTVNRVETTVETIYSNLILAEGVTGSLPDPQTSRSVSYDRKPGNPGITFPSLKMNFNLWKSLDTLAVAISFAKRSKKR